MGCMQIIVLFRMTFFCIYTIGMTVLDWIIVAFIGIGVVIGYSKGIIRQLASLVGLVAGLLIARAMFTKVGETLAAELGASLTFAQVLAFVLIGVLVPVGFLLLASVMTKAVEVVRLGFVNRLLGAGMGCLKYLIFAALFINLVEYIDSESSLIAKTTKSSSVLYYPIKELSEFFYPTVRSVTKQLIETEICKKNPINM